MTNISIETVRKEEDGTIFILATIDDRRFRVIGSIIQEEGTGAMDWEIEELLPYEKWDTVIESILNHSDSLD
jgi:hypothetical protein